MSIIDEIEKEQIKEITRKRNVPKFNAGDSLKIHLIVVEGNRERIQVFEGLCIAKSNRGLNSTFTVRKISNGEGVERVFPLYSPLIEKFEVIRRGDVRRAKLYYLRDRSGKKARIAEKRVDKVSEDNGIESSTLEKKSETQKGEEIILNEKNKEKKSELKDINSKNKDDKKSEKNIEKPNKD